LYWFIEVSYEYQPDDNTVLKDKPAFAIQANV